MAYVSLDGGVAVLATMADDSWAVMRFSGDGKPLWREGCQRGARQRATVADE